MPRPIFASADSDRATFQDDDQVTHLCKAPSARIKRSLTGRITGFVGGAFTLRMGRKLGEGPAGLAISSGLPLRRTVPGG